MQIKKFDSINVVPFIDIMLVLLVIVLTTATFVAQGMIPVDLSTAKSSSKLTKNDTLTITIKENQNIFFNKTKISKQDIEKNLLKYKSNTAIKLNCDKNLKFSEFIYLVDILKEKNFTNLNIVTKYE
ncbi:biopolymer transporter ExbD [Arcobacter sp. 15-2]|uniref:ExbD/TolR family protein n=1 Tax=Arcobacter sp. 15-2 TaxID=3374109 RepID=UPI00399CBA5D